LNFALGSLLANSDAPRHTDQVGVLEFDARALVAVVEQYVESGGLERGGDFESGGALDGIGGIDGGHDDIEWGNGWGQVESGVIVVLLDSARQDAFDAYAIAAHDGRDFFAIAVEHACPHRLGILVAKLEDVPDLHRLRYLERSAAVGAPFALRHVAQVGVLGDAKVAARSHVLQVKI